MKNALRTVGAMILLAAAFSVLYILASLVLKGHVDWY